VELFSMVVCLSVHLFVFFANLSTQCFENESVILMLIGTSGPQGKA